MVNTINDIIAAGTAVPTTRPERVIPTHSPWWSRLALAGVVLVSIFMDFYLLGVNGYGNLYYASGVRSMLDSWYNFFFVAYDPGGFVTIDKPPLGFWLQTLSAKLFGLTPFSVLLPQALAGVFSVLVLYRLVQRRFGAVAGLLAALALAISPISVVTNRNNTIDSTLTLVLLLGAWAVLRAAETGKLRWLLLCAALVGIGFNIKMMEAFLVLPAYGLLYLLAAPRTIWMRLVHLALATLLLLAISLSWVVTVDLIPSSQRPYVGSSQDNSEVSLALGYNGISRLLGMFGLGGNRGGGAPPQGVQNGGTSAMPQPPSQGNSTSSQSNGNTTGQGEMPQFPRGGDGNGGPANRGGNGNNPGGAFNTGEAGLFRLFNLTLGGQIAWLLPLALLAMIALAWQRRPGFPLEGLHQSLVLWGVWFLTMGIFFSVAGFFHPYYLTVMAPAVCALFGCGTVVMWRDYRTSSWRGWLLPLAIGTTIAGQIYLLSSYPTWSAWMSPLIAGIGGAAIVVLAVARLLPRIRERWHALVPVLCAGILVLLIAPAVWAAIPVLNGYASQLPAAGPTDQGGRAFGGAMDMNTGANTALIRYLEAHQGNAKYLVATMSSQSASEIILATNKPVMALGGFSGSDPILTVDELAALVKSGQVRYFLISGGGGGAGGQSSLISWIQSNCKQVASSAWQSSTNSSGLNNGAGGGTLYYYAG